MKSSSKSAQSSVTSIPELNSSRPTDVSNNARISEPGKIHSRRLTKKLKPQSSHCSMDGYKTLVLVSVLNDASNEVWAKDESRCR